MVPARLAAIALLLTGCASTVRQPALTCPDRGGPRWVAIASERLVVKSDLPRERAEAVARDIAEAHALARRAFEALVAPASMPPPTERLQVVVFARALDVQALDPAADGYFHWTRVGWDERPTIVVSGDALDEGGRRLLRHEIVHWLVAHWCTS
jgi:hypothetical protein